LEEIAMQRSPTASWLLAVTLPLLLAACTVDQPISAKSNMVDASKGGGSGGNASTGAGGKATSGAGGMVGSAGSIDQTGGGGAGGASGGAGGSAGSTDTDASNDASADDVVETGPMVPEASTCAGFALQFSGVADYASINRVVQDDFTLEAWLKTSMTSLTGVNFWDGTGLIYADRPMSVDDFGMSMVNGHLTMGVGNPDTTLEGTSMINTGQWVHIATTRKRSTGEIQVIVNGVLETTRTVAAQTRPLTAPTEITIGGNTVDGRYLNGIMDEVRLWNVVRTPTEITNTMHKTLTGNEAGLVGYWKFDEGTGVSAAGKIGGDAQLYNQPQWVPSDAPICQ
jgi:hypothetical protein